MNRIASWSSQNPLGAGLVYGSGLFILIVSLGPSLISWLYESVLHIGTIGPHLPLWILVGAGVSSMLGCVVQFVVWRTIVARQAEVGLVMVLFIYFVPTLCAFVLIAVTAP